MSAVHRPGQAATRSLVVVGELQARLVGCQIPNDERSISPGAAGPIRRRHGGEERRGRGREDPTWRRRRYRHPNSPRTRTMAPKSSATSRTDARPSDLPRSVTARSASCFGSSHSFCWSAAVAAGGVSGTGERSLTASLKTRWTSAAIFARSVPGRRETRTRVPSGFPTLAELLSTPSIPFSRASTGASRCAQPARVRASRPSRKICSRPRLAPLLPATPAKLPSARLATTRSEARQATRRACRCLAFSSDRTLNPIFAVLRRMEMSPYRLHLLFPSVQIYRS